MKKYRRYNPKNASNVRLPKMGSKAIKGLPSNASESAYQYRKKIY